jgi:hypothetical protein
MHSTVYCSYMYEILYETRFCTFCNWVPKGSSLDPSSYVPVVLWCQTFRCTKKDAMTMFLRRIVYYS